MGQVKGGHECTPGAAVPPQDDARCTLLELIDASKDGDDAVRREWLSESYEGDRMIRVGCATSALDNIKLFAGRSKARAAMLDLETLERMINQEPLEAGTTNKWSNSNAGKYERVKYCGLTEKGYRNLQNAINKKRLNEKDVCIPYDDLARNARIGFVTAVDSGESSGVIPGVTDSEYCDTYKNVGANECGVSFEKSNQGDNEKESDEKGTCKFDTSKCYFDGGELHKYDKTKCEKKNGYEWKDGDGCKKKTS